MSNRVVLLSQREISKLVAFSLAYEFEDVIQASTGAERIVSTNPSSIERARRTYKLLRTATASPTMARALTPDPAPAIQLNGEVDLFVAVFSHFHEVYSLSSVPDWRKRSKKAICFITEVWSHMIPTYLAEQLAEFDHVFVGLKHGADALGRLTGQPCSYLPLAVDVAKFAPASIGEARPIELCNIGRRSPVTHAAMLARTQNAQSFYYYDTVAASGSDNKDRTFRVDNPEEHRRLLASLLKRSQFYITNRSFVNRPEFLDGREEISARFYEGAASGAIMIGEAPRCAHFREQFDWPDSVIEMPFDSPEIGKFLDDLKRTPDRLMAARSANVMHAARRHDWVYRIQDMFDAIGLPHTEQMHMRVEQLEDIAASVSAQSRDFKRDSVTHASLMVAARND